MSKDPEKKIHDDLEKDSSDFDLLQLKKYLADRNSVNTSDQLKLAIIGEMLSGKSVLLTTLRNSCIHDSEIAADFFERTIENKELAVNAQDTLTTPNESKYSTELDEIFTQLHDTDRYIAKTRKNTVRLGIETRSMLNDLRQQLG